MSARRILGIAIVLIGILTIYSGYLGIQYESFPPGIWTTYFSGEDAIREGKRAYWVGALIIVLGLIFCFERHDDYI